MKWGAPVIIIIGVAVSSAWLACSDRTCEEESTCAAASTNEAGTSSSSGTLPDGAPNGGEAGPGTCTDTTTEQNCGACGNTCTPNTGGCINGKCGGSVIAMGGGASFTCAVTLAGHVWCWGDNSKGQTGDPNNTIQPTPRRIETDASGKPFDHVVDIGVGGTHACVTKDNNTLWCWGTGYTNPTASSPRPVQLNGTYKQVRVGGFQITCAITTTGTVDCWGQNYRGSLGHEPNSNGDVATGAAEYFANGSPVRVSLAGGAPLIAEKIAVASANFGACALTASKQVYCWGENPYGELALDPEQVTYRATPVEIAGFAGATDIKYTDNPLVLIGGQMKGLGGNFYGQLGNGKIVDYVNATPQTFGNLTNVEVIGGGILGLCVYNGAVYCAGWNYSGLLANGSIGTGDSMGDPFPKPTLGRDGATMLTDIDQMTSTGASHTCVRAKDGSMWCWGSNSNGQIGNGKSGTELREPKPTRVLGLP